MEFYSSWRKKTDEQFQDVTMSMLWIKLGNEFF